MVEIAASSRRGLGWPVLLAGLLLLLALRVVFLDRSDWPGFVGDEATYLMAAESLAWDGDFLYQRSDYDRFSEHWGERDELLLFLQSKDHGGTLVYGKPFFFPLAAAPLTRLWPTHGALLTNVLFLALAAFLSARALSEFLDGEAALWVAVFVFGSVAFAYPAWAHADSLLMSATAIAVSLAVLDRKAAPQVDSLSVRRPGDRVEARRLATWFGIGALLAVVAFSRPFYASLVVPFVAALPRGKRLRLGTAFAAGALVVVALSAAAHWHLAGAVTSYTGERGGFYARVGLPEVDFPGQDWDQAIRRTGNFSWYQARQPLEQETRLGLWTWNSVYFLFGEHVGLLPYFLPVLLVFFGLRLDLFRWFLLFAILISLTAFFLYRPFNFFGGGAAIGNRYLLPLYPVFWFLIGRRPSLAIRRWAPLTVSLLAFLFLWPLWSRLGSYPLTAEQTYEFVSPVARKLLPYETTQSHLKPGGQEDVMHNDLWVRVLSPGTRADKSRLWVRPGSWAEILIARQRPLSELEVIGPAGRFQLETTTGELVSERKGEGVVIHTLRMPGARARHSMWWTWQPLHLYRLRFRFSNATGVDGDDPAEIVGFYLSAPVEGN